jgi:hypothetical protein
MSPFGRPAQIVDMSSIRVIAIRVEPPRHTEAVSWRQGSKDAKFQKVTDVADISILHSQMTTRDTVPISDSSITDPPEMMPLACTGCLFPSKKPAGNRWIMQAAFRVIAPGKTSEAFEKREASAAHDRPPGQPRVPSVFRRAR